MREAGGAAVGGSTGRWPALALPARRAASPISTSAPGSGRLSRAPTARSLGITHMAPLATVWHWVGQPASCARRVEALGDVGLFVMLVGQSDGLPCS